MRYLRNTILLIAFSFLVNAVFSQKNEFLSNDLIFPFFNQNDTIGSSIHTSIRPFLTTTPSTAQKIGIDHVSMDFNLPLNKKKDQFALSFSPVVSTVGGYESGDTNAFNYDLTLGLATNLSIGNKLWVNFNWIENYSKLNSISKLYYNELNVLPGFEKASVWDGVDDGLTYGQSHGYLSYSPSKYFNFQLGRGKNFFGEGYRSLILSDNGPVNDFFKIRTSFWKVEYVNLFNRMKTFGTRADNHDKYIDKYSSMHYLSWNVSKRLNIGVFEAIVWQSEDSLVTRGFDVYYLNPIIFYRPVEFSVGSPDNALIGGQLSYRVSKGIKLYGQFMLDEFLLKEVSARNGWWANKQAFQFGTKYYNAFNIDRFTLQMEFNYIRPYTYSHSLTSQNYTHYNQSIAHPDGANLREVLLLMNYYKDKWYFETQLIYTEKGLDPNQENYGGNIRLSNNIRPENREYGNNTTQGLLTKIINAEAKVSRKIGNQNNVRIEGVMRYFQSENSNEKRSLVFLTLGVKSNLFNLNKVSNPY